MTDYVVDLAGRHAHLYAVEGVFAVAAGATHLELHLPVWTPGSYLIREYERHIQELCAHGVVGGNALVVDKTDKATWRIAVAGQTSVRVRWRVYAWDLTVRAAHLDDTHAFWNGACLFLYADHLKSKPHRVKVKAPSTFRVTTSLDLDTDGAYVAADYDELVDSPFEVGTHELVEFEVRHKPHRLAIWGQVPTPRPELVGDIVKVVETASAIFDGELPYAHYTFLLLSSPGQYGGLEHLRSCTLLTSPFTFRPRAKYEEFLELVSHEFFHLWNVKRIRPFVLGPFDYQREAYTRSLWVMEGITSYYDRHILVRAGLQQPGRYLEKLAEELAKIGALPGRFRQSLEESSFDAWIKLYRPDEHTGNSTISYYLKGGVVALLLDLDIRARSDGARSLDDVMRALYARCQATKAGFADNDVQTLMEEATALSLQDFFDKLIRGRGDIDPAPYLRSVGLQARPEESSDEPRGFLGATLKESGDAVRVVSVLEEGPATVAGLYAGDDIVALDGFRVSHTTLKERLSLLRPGDVARLTLFRRDELRHVAVPLGQAPNDSCEIVPVTDSTEAERAAYQRWLGAAWTPAHE